MNEGGCEFRGTSGRRSSVFLRFLCRVLMHTNRRRDLFKGRFDSHTLLPWRPAERTTLLRNYWYDGLVKDQWITLTSPSVVMIQAGFR